MPWYTCKNTYVYTQIHARTGKHITHTYGHRTTHIYIKYIGTYTSMHV